MSNCLPAGYPLLLLALLAAVACSSPDVDNSTQVFDAEALEAWRQEKDREFGGSQSPLLAEDRENFEGLRYFKPAPEYLVRAEFAPFARPEIVYLQTSKGDEQRELLRYGEFRFQLGGQQCSLTAFKYAGEYAKLYPRHLFLPFSDSTSGRESYGAGRYLDVMELSDDDIYYLDFNMAYNPYCAYNYAYSCPLVPEENKLPVAVRGGEMTFAHR